MELPAPGTLSMALPCVPSSNTLHRTCDCVLTVLDPYRCFDLASMFVQATLLSWTSTCSGSVFTTFVLQIDDAAAFAYEVLANHPTVPHFVGGQSLGGLITTMVGGYTVCCIFTCKARGSICKQQCMLLCSRLHSKIRQSGLAWCSAQLP